MICITTNGRRILVIDGNFFLFGANFLVQCEIACGPSAGNLTFRLKGWNTGSIELLDMGPSLH